MAERSRKTRTKKSERTTRTNPESAVDSSTKSKSKARPRRKSTTARVDDATEPKGKRQRQVSKGKVVAQEDNESKKSESVDDEQDLELNDDLDASDVEEEDEEESRPGRRRWKPPKIDKLKEETERDTIRIIKRIQAGETHLIRQLINRYRAQVAGIAYKMVGDYDDAKDIAQMVFVKTYYNIHRFDTTKRFSTWLYRIAVNAAIDYIRKFKKQRFEELDESRETVEHKRPNPEQIFQLKELRNHVLKAADKLNEKQRTAFVLKDLEGLDINEISQIMGMPQATVRWYLHRARKKLRADLQRRYGPILTKLGLLGSD